MIRQPASKVILRAEDLAEYEKVSATWTLPPKTTTLTNEANKNQNDAEERKRLQRERIGMPNK